ncbi:MAG: hypothetical protein AAF989_08790, partial [Planctomycetota bacterium]
VAVTLFDVGDFHSFNRTLAVAPIDTTPARNQPQSVSGSILVGESKGDATETASNATSTGSAPATDTQVGPTSVTAELKIYEDDVAYPVIRNGRLALPELQTVDRVSVDVIPGRRTEFELTAPPWDASTRRRTRHGVIELTGQDSFRLDDRYFLTWSIQDPRPLLIVGEDQVNRDLVAWTATAPLSPDDTNAEFAIDDDITYEDFVVIDPNDYPAIVLLDPPASTLSQERLSRYVRQGGRVFVTMGANLSRTPVSTFKDWTAESGWPEIKRVWNVPDEGTFFQIVRDTNPAVSMLTSLSPRPRWSQFRVRQYWQLKTSPQDRVVIRYAGSGHAALLSRDHGAGRWMIMTSPLALADGLVSGTTTRPWNHLFGADSWPTFVLVRQIIESMMDDRTTRKMITVGERVRLLTSPGSEDAPSSISSERNTSDDGRTTVAPAGRNDTVRWQLFAPDAVTAQPIDVSPSDPAPLLSPAMTAGNHWMKSARRSDGFSVNVPRSGILGAKVDESILDEWFEASSADRPAYRLVSRRESLEFDSESSEIVVSLHSPAMLFALAVFLLEQILGNRFYRATS